MNPETFALQAFMQASSPVFSDVLAKNLGEEVPQEIGPAVAKAFEKVIRELNLAGYALEPYGPQSAGELHYRDVGNTDNYRTLLACDVVITAGFDGRIPARE